MSKKLLKLLFMILCFPVIAITGIPGDGGDQDPPPGDGGNQDPPGDDGADNLPKTLEELKSLMKKEKLTGKQAATKDLLKELGITDIKDLKDGWGKYREYLEQQKTNEEKLTDSLKDTTEKLTASEERAQKAERKLSLITLGCNPETLEDVTALVVARITDEKGFDEAAKEIKDKYPTFFGAGQDGGTGGVPGGGRSKGSNTTGMGERLAKSNQVASKNPYFNN